MKEDKHLGLQGGALFWDTYLVFTASSSVSPYLVILPSCWTFLKIRECSLPSPDYLKATWQTSLYCVSLGAGGMPLVCYVYREHFFTVKMLSEVLVTSSLQSHSGLWWPKRMWGSGSNFDPHPVFRTLASPPLPRGLVLENSTCFSWNKDFWKAGRPSWQRSVWGRGWGSGSPRDVLLQGRPSWDSGHRIPEGRPRRPDHTCVWWNRAAARTCRDSEIMKGLSSKGYTSRSVCLL